MAFGLSRIGIIINLRYFLLSFKKVHFWVVTNFPSHTPSFQLLSLSAIAIASKACLGYAES